MTSASATGRVRAPMRSPPLQRLWDRLSKTLRYDIVEWPPAFVATVARYKET